MEENNRTFEFAARFASEKEIVRFTRFLDPAQAVEAERIARHHGVKFSSWGAFMALGLTRDSIGDIIIVDSDIYLFVVEQVADFILQGMTSAGKAALHFKRVEGEVSVPEPQGMAFHDTLSSMRLDAVLAGAYRLSRTESSALIRGGLVKLNHIPCERVDAAVEEGALLSVRGKGRVRLQSIEGLTRKQRIGVTFFRYE